MVKVHKAAADLHVPDGLPLEAALKRVTYLGIGAHHDDLEFMAFHGITECFGRECFCRYDRWCGGVTCTNGTGSARGGDYPKPSDAEIVKFRQSEQRMTPELGGYRVMFRLDYTQRRESFRIRFPPVTARHINLRLLGDFRTKYGPDGRETHRYGRLL